MQTFIALKYSRFLKLENSENLYFGMNSLKKTCTTVCEKECNGTKILTLTGLNKMNSVSLLDKYRDMLCNVAGSFVFIVLYVEDTKSPTLARNSIKY